MSIENFKKFDEPRMTRIEYDFDTTDCDVPYPVGAKVKLIGWNSYKDVINNLTGELEKKFKKELDEMDVEGEDFYFVFHSEVEIDGEWKECLLMDNEVPFAMIYDYVVFEEAITTRKEIVYEIDRNGHRISGVCREREINDIVDIDLYYTYYNLNGKAAYFDFDKVEKKNGETKEEALYRAVNKELEVWVHDNPYLKIGRPPKK